MGGGKTTNVTNTGLGDDQYQVLADNQVGISGQIDTARDDATARYDSFDGRFGGLDTNLSSGFTNMQGLMDTYNTGMNRQFDKVNTGVGSNNTKINRQTKCDKTNLTLGITIKLNELQIYC